MYSLPTPGNPRGLLWALSSLPLATDLRLPLQVINWRRVQQPTNGYFGLRLALMLCERVEIYGFLRTWQGWVPYHAVALPLRTVSPSSSACTIGWLFSSSALYFAWMACKHRNIIAQYY